MIENTTNEKMKAEAISAIVQDLSYAGKKSEARQYALLYPEEKRDEIEKYYLEGEELIRHDQKLMMKELGHLLSRLNLFFDDYHLHIAVELIKLFFPDENYLDKHYIMYFYQVSKSKQLIKDGDLSQALVHLEKARFHAVEADKIEFDDRGEYAYTSPVFDKLTVDTSTFLHTNDVPALQNFAEHLDDKDFDVLRSNIKFQEIQHSLK